LFEFSVVPVKYCANFAAFATLLMASVLPLILLHILSAWLDWYAWPKYLQQ